MIGIILAGGKGSRMKTNIPKCIMPLKGKPMLNYLIETLNKIQIDRIYVVVSYQKEMVKKTIKEEVVFVEQKIPLGTAHAVKSCKEVLKNIDDNVLILASDMPLIKQEVLEEFINYHLNKNNDLTILSTIVDNPYGMGRIIKKDEKHIKIIEEKDLTDLEKNIKEVNTSIYCIKSHILLENIDKINNQNQSGEYYLTDIVEIVSNKYQVDIYKTNYTFHLQGINDYETLKQIEDKMGDI